MSAELATYEVEVEVIRGNSRYGYYPVHAGSKAVKGCFIKDTIVKLFQFENVKRERAIELGNKHGKVKSCRKIDAYEGLLSIEQMDLDHRTIYDKGNPYVSPIAMGEMPWKKKARRIEKKLIDNQEI